MTENKKFIVAQEAQYDELLEKVSRIENLILGQAKVEAEAQWLDSDEARKMLGVSSKTWQSWRDGRLIPFVQFGRKIWVKRADIESFLQSHYVAVGGARG